MTNSELNKKKHWEKVYSKTDDKQLGWFQKTALPSLQLIEKTGIDLDELIVDVGSGASVLIDELVSLNYQNIIATDISETALNISKKRLNKEESDKVSWIVDDFSNPTSLNKIKNVAIWHDRAVLHFFTTKKDQQTYLKLLNNCVKKEKHVIIAAFNFDSVDKCSGLPVEKYNKEKLQEFLGKDYKLLDSFNYEYTMPSGATRPYVYTLFQKKK